MLFLWNFCLSLSKANELIVCIHSIEICKQIEVIEALNYLEWLFKNWLGLGTPRPSSSTAPEYYCSCGGVFRNFNWWVLILILLANLANLNLLYGTILVANTGLLQTYGCCRTHCTPVKTALYWVSKLPWQGVAPVLMNSESLSRMRSQHCDGSRATLDKKFPNFDIIPVLFIE